ncbi:MAG TPA: hypothetical protein VID24_13030 [Candidatus Eremiobacteraceae bacterium]
MNHMRVKFSVGATVVAVCAALAIGAAAMVPASSSTIASTIAATECSSSSPCVEVRNSGAGQAIEGTSVQSDAIFGRTKAFSAKGGAREVMAGVLGEDVSVPPAGQEDFSSGVVGRSRSGFGIMGFSRIHAGVVGLTTNPSLTDGYGTAGVEGFDQSSDGGQNDLGVEGGTTAGTGVFGFSSLGNGVRGVTFNPSSQNQQHRAAVFGIDMSTDGGGLNFGVAGFSPGTGIAGLSVAGPTAQGAPIAPAVAAVCLNGGAAIQAVTSLTTAYTLLMTLDCGGNLTVSGTIMSQAAMVDTKTVDGRDVAAYQARQTQATIEDFGEGQIVGGMGSVRLNADFASTIDRRGGYLVFITPEGDSRGLYVEHKTGTGFDVRESQGGRSSIAFSYRIVAHPMGADDGRLPAVRDVMARESAGIHRPGMAAAKALRQLGITKATSPSVGGE